MLTWQRKQELMDMSWPELLWLVKWGNLTRAELLFVRDHVAGMGNLDNLDVQELLMVVEGEIVALRY